LARAFTVDPSRFDNSPKEEIDVDHRFVSVTQATKLDKLVEELESERGLALVFVRTKRGADRLAYKLARVYVRAAARRGARSQGQRHHVRPAGAAGRRQPRCVAARARRGIRRRRDDGGACAAGLYEPPRPPLALVTPSRDETLPASADKAEADPSDPSRKDMR